MTKKILLMAGHSRAVHKWGMLGEVVKRLLEDKNNEVYYLDCGGQLPGYCGLNQKKHFGYCKKCYPMCLKIIKLAGLDDKNIITLKKFKAPEFPNFKSTEEALNYEFEGYNYGLAPVSSIMTITRDYDFNIKKWNKTIKKFFQTEYIIFKNLEELDNTFQFDEFHTFNGRMSSMYPVVAYAIKNQKPYVVYDRGAGLNVMKTLHNTVPHDFFTIKKEIKELWNRGASDRIELAQKWFNDRRKGNVHKLEMYTKDQIKNLLPKDFDTNKENIVFFNSSIDEVFAFDCWKLPFGKTENNIIKAILEHYKNDNKKHFYLRVHPNLIKAKKKHTSQIREINEFKKQYPNLSVIEPDEKIDTYALMEACDKILSTYSTVACEATYWGKISIIAGKAVYDELDCVYVAKSLENLFELIDNPNLQPKPKENTYPFGYRTQIHGEKYRYFNEISLNEGTFMGELLKS